MSSSPPPAPEPPAAPEPPPPPELAPALARFEAGDFRGARRLIDELLATQPGPDTAAAARALRARMDIDPAAFGVGVFVLGLLALVATAYL